METALFANDGGRTLFTIKQPTIEAPTDFGSGMYKFSARELALSIAICSTSASRSSCIQVLLPSLRRGLKEFAQVLEFSCLWTAFGKSLGESIGHHRQGHSDHD